MRPQTDNETFYPRAADELRLIEDQIGKVYVLLNLTKDET